MTQQLTPTLSLSQTLSPTWNVAVETMRGFLPFYQEQTTAAMRQAPPHWFFLVIAAANDPRPLTVDQLQAIFPYNQRQALQDALQPMLEGGYLEAAGDGAYVLTAAGRALIQSFYDAAHAALRDFTPLPQADLEELRDLLQAIVHDARSPLPAHHSIFHVGRNSDPGPQAGLAAQLDQLLTDLYYFRDDAHVAAWQPTDLDGVAFEALTLIWRDEAHSAEELAAKLANRLLSATDYAAALQRLAQRGLVALDGDTATTTPAGRRLRKQVEARTDERFYAPWQALDPAQQQRLHALLQQLHDAQQRAARIRMWPLIDSVAAALQPLVTDEVRPVLQERVDPPIIFNHMRMAREAQPQPHNLQRFLTRFPYASPQRATERLQLAVEKGFMHEENGQYTLTPQGEAVVDAVNDVFYAALGALEPLPAAQIDRLNALLQRLVDAALSSDAPSTDRLRMTHDTAQPRDYGPLARLDLVVDDLNAFRDDAHQTAWAAHFTSGRDWETLTYVWRDQAHDAARLAEQLTFRGWDEAAYQSSLDALVKRGWLQEQDGRYTITPAGDDLRRRVEKDTDDLFYATWDQALTAQEQNELRTLLVRLKIELQALRQAREGAA